jgi:hypothetical protein
MDFIFGLMIGSIAGPFVYELLKWGYRKVKEKTAN